MPNGNGNGMPWTGQEKKRKYKENKLNNKPHILTNNTRSADKKKLRVKFAPDVLEIQASY